MKISYIIYRHLNSHVTARELPATVGIAALPDPIPAVIPRVLVWAGRDCPGVSSTIFVFKLYDLYYCIKLEKSGTNFKITVFKTVTRITTFSGRSILILFGTGFLKSYKFIIPVVYIVK